MQIQWEKFKFPHESLDEEDEEHLEDEPSYEYSEEEMGPGMKLGQILSLSGQSENPFLQLRTFNFWVGYTDFKVTLDMLEKIANVDGVESLDYITRYRLIMSVGKLFSPRDVFAKIQEVVNETNK